MLPAIIRRKNCATLIVFATCMFYFMWLVHLKTDSSTSNIDENSNEKSHHNHHKQQQIIIKDKNEHILFVNDHFKSTHAIETIKKELILDESKLDNLFKYLYKNKAFCAQIDVLHELSVHKSRISYDFLRKYSNSLHKLTLTFGIHEDFVPKLISPKQVDTLNDECEVKISNITHLSDTYDSTVTITCASIQIHVSIFHRRNEFLWIPKQEHDLDVPQMKWFGDVARGMNKFDTQEITLNGDTNMYIPESLDDFLFDYKNSKFLECNRELAYENLNTLGLNYTQDLKKNKMLQPVIVNISKTLEKLHKNYWLAGGTLLGWYRDCGIIPHTQDVDFAIWSHEYETSIKKAFLGNKLVRIWGTLGLLNDSFEFRMYNDKFTFDMFLVYKLNETTQWCGYQVNRLKYRRFLPNFDELCSAELLNNKLYVPCDPVAYLNKEYGRAERWKTPKEKNYTWSNVIYNSKWSDEQWPHVIKFYDKSGTLLKQKILEAVNKHLSSNLTKIDGLDNDD